MVVIRRAIVCCFVWHKRTGLWHANPPPKTLHLPPPLSMPCSTPPAHPSLCIFSYHPKNPKKLAPLSPARRCPLGWYSPDRLLRIFRRICPHHALWTPCAHCDTSPDVSFTQNALQAQHMWPQSRHAARLFPQLYQPSAKSLSLISASGVATPDDTGRAHLGKTGSASPLNVVMCCKAPHVAGRRRSFSRVNAPSLFTPEVISPTRRGCSFRFKVDGGYPRSIC